VATVSECLDYLAHVASFPVPDSKLRTTSLFLSPGGNALQALVCLSRLGINVKLVTKLGDDEVGRQLLATLQKEGHLSTTLIKISTTNSPFSYIIVDDQTHTRTIIHTPGALLSPEEIEPSFLDGATLFLNDGRQGQAGVKLAQLAVERNIPIIMDCDEPGLEGNSQGLDLADYLVFNRVQIIQTTKSEDVLEAMATFLTRPFTKPKKFVIVTLGAEGSLLMHAHKNENEILLSLHNEKDKEKEKENVHANEKEASEPILQIKNFQELEKHIRAYNKSGGKPSYFLWEKKKHQKEEKEDEKEKETEKEQEQEEEKGSSILLKICYCPCFSIETDQIVDTTGAGDVFVGGICYGLVRRHHVGRMLALASCVAAKKCLGSGLCSIPYLNDLPPPLLE
jgi:sugar/nucleoside kinase (ribokinase family)